MKILEYDIPPEFQGNEFIQSLHKQFQEKGRLTQRQRDVLQDIIEVELDFFAWDWDPSNLPVLLMHDYADLLEKLRRNRFRSVKGRNRCVRALLTLVNDLNPDKGLVDAAMGRGYQHNRGYRTRYSNARRFW